MDGNVGTLPHDVRPADLLHGDALRLQYLNNIEINRDEIKIASDHGTALLEFILGDMGEAGSKG